MTWDIQKYRVKLELNQPLLGTVPCSKSIFTDHIATQQAKKLKKEGMSEDEIAAELKQTIEGVEDIDKLEVGKTTFFKDDQGYYLRDYQIRGFFKETARPKKEFGAMKQLRAKVASYLFVRPYKVYVAPADAELEVVERPLRASTPQGERVTIARSHSIPAGTVLEFELHSLDGVATKALIETLLEYGDYTGFGQWRGSGAGSFKVLDFEKI